MLETKSTVLSKSIVLTKRSRKYYTAFIWNNPIYLEFWEKQPGTADRAGKGCVDRGIKLVPRVGLYGMV